jgi:hypothetical protein
MTPYQAALAKKKTKKKAKHAKSYGGAEWVKYGDAASGKTTLHPAYITPLPVVGPSLKTDIGLAHGIKRCDSLYIRIGILQGPSIHSYCIRLGLKRRSFLG